MSDSHFPLPRGTADRTRALFWAVEWLTPGIQDGTILDRTIFFVLISIFVRLVGRESGGVSQGLTGLGRGGGVQGKK